METPVIWDAFALIMTYFVMDLYSVVFGILFRMFRVFTEFR